MIEHNGPIRLITSTL